MVNLTEQGTTHDSPKSSEAEMVNLNTEEGTAPVSSYSSLHNSSNKAETVDLTMENTSEPETPSEPTVVVANTPSTGSEEQLTLGGRSVPESSVTFTPLTSSGETIPSNTSAGTSERQHSATVTLQPSVKYSSTQTLSYTSPDTNMTVETRLCAKGDLSVESESQFSVAIITSSGTVRLSTNNGGSAKQEGSLARSSTSQGTGRYDAGSLTTPTTSRDREPRTNPSTDQSKADKAQGLLTWTSDTEQKDEEINKSDTEV